MHRFWIIAGLALFALLGFVVFPFVIGVPWDLVFSSDAIGYSTGAKNLLLHGYYTFDGIHPFMDREPMMSFFLVPMYAIFGVENGIALALIQGLFYFLASLFFCHEASKRIGSRAAGICFLLLLSSGSVFHTIFSAYRECLALTLLLVFSGFFLSSAHRSRFWKTVLMGFLLGLAVLTYYPLIFFPPFFLVAFFLDRRSLRDGIIIVLLCYAVTSLWSLRNYSYDGKFRVIDNRRTVVMWYVRGEQAERVTGIMPLRCLLAEYVTRDWTGLSDACSFNGLMHTRWPEGFDLTVNYGNVEGPAKAKIRSNFLNYLNFSFYEILELHLPYVGGGWSHAFNTFAAMTQAVLAVGFLFGIRRILDVRISLFVALIAYNTAVFILTDATPRYLLPVFFCYAVIAGIGYDSLLKRCIKQS